MVLADFAAHPDAREAHLEDAHVAALRLYSSEAYESINEPLRDQQVAYLPHLPYLPYLP